MENRPKLRVEGTSRKNARVFLQCSECDCDIREIKPHESVSVTRAYLCKDCDDGVIRMNPPILEDKPHD